MASVDVRNVVKVYRRQTEELRVLDGLTLSIPDGAFVALMGPSGSGKTTLLNLIGGIDQPTSRRRRGGGTNIARSRAASSRAGARASIGYIFQLYNLIPVLTALENVELPLLLVRMSAGERGSAPRPRSSWWASATRSKHYPRQLSGGQEQRVAIARAHRQRSQVLLADEPTGDLDRKSAEEVLELLERLNREFKKTIVMVTHDPHAAERATTRYHLDKGVLSKTEPGLGRPGE
jgi:putative ABC transport system ATP-binding protein